jgi:hypothetical protein
MYNLFFKYSIFLEIFSIRRRKRTEAERVFDNIFFPALIIILSVGAICGALHRMKKAKELYEMSSDLAPPPEGRNKRIIALSVATILLCLVDFSIKFTSNGIAVIFGGIMIFVLGTMSAIDTSDGYTGKQNRFKITKISEPTIWDYGNDMDGNGIDDKAEELGLYDKNDEVYELLEPKELPILPKNPHAFTDNGNK